MNSNKIKYEFKNKGFIVIKNFYNLKKIIQIKKSLSKFTSYNISKKNGHSVFEKIKKKKYLKYFKKINLYIDEFNYFISTKTLNTAKQLIGKDVYYYNMGLHNKPPKISQPTPIHQDNFYWNLKNKDGLTAYIPLNKQNKKNGGIGYFVGSHKDKTFDHKKSNTKAFSSFIENKQLEKYKLEFINAKPGDIIFHHCNIAHKTFKNMTQNQQRIAVAITFYGIDAKFDIKMRNKYFNNLKN